MFKRLWNRIKNRNRGEGEEGRGPALGEMQEAMLTEFNAVKKLLRKQSLLVEEVRASLSRETGEEPSDTPDQQLIRLAAAFFHLEQSVRGQSGFSSQRRETFDLFWLQLEQMLATKGIQIIRESGGEFDPRRHQAVLSRAPDARHPRVVEVLQPGFLENGKVKKPAKVILGPSEENEQEARGENIE